MVSTCRLGMLMGSSYSPGLALALVSIIVRLRIFGVGSEQGIK
jgi:hypothetical protein